ncbi:MAG: hypothetical protein BWY66_00400 [bacterium ADurb.Bin374]|nr:MAG: hypothetical protein BWY66_00400 [bacterium ADurb.Bin374]
MKLKTFGFTDLLSHVDSKGELGEYLTVFTGPSDNGKSGAMRGLNQLFRNQPAGIDLLRHGAKRGACSEAVCVFDGDDGKEHRLVRRRGKSKNEYELDGQQLLAIGRDVPEEVSGLLKLSPHAFQLQQDGTFMLCETDGEVAKMLSSTVGLAQIDAAFSLVKARKDKNDTALRLAQSDEEREKAALARFAGLDAATEAVIDAEYAESAVDTVNSQIAVLDTAVRDMAGLRPDCTGDVEWAVSRLNDAVASANDSAENHAALEAMVRLLASLSRLPGNAETEPARMALADLAESLRLCDDEATLLAGRVLLLDRLSDLPKDIGLMPRRAALLITQALAADKAYLDASVALTRLEGILACLSAYPDDAIGKLISAEQAINSTIFFAETAELKRKIADGLQDMLEAISSACTRCFSSTVALGNADKEIEDYRREHPECPECGAEQKHWRIGEKK